MGLLGAIEMKKTNENNLSRLSHGRLHDNLEKHGSYSTKRVYKYKEASPELLARIRDTRKLENEEQKRKRSVILLACAFFFVVLLTLISTL